MEKFPEIIARELQLKFQQVKATMALLEDGATIPFIARYRKEATGLLDETKIAPLMSKRCIGTQASSKAAGSFSIFAATSIDWL